MRYEWSDADAGAMPGRWTDPLPTSDEVGVWVRKEVDPGHAGNDPARETNPRI
jgi:hypothetical protein